MVLEFQRSDRVGNVLDGIRLAMREIVAGVDFPSRPGAWMRCVQDAIEHGIAQVDVARCHVDLGAQHAGTVREFTGAHACEQVEVFLGRSAAEWTVPPRLGQGAAREPDLLLRLVVDKGLAGDNQVLRPAIELLEIIGRIVKVRPPVEAEPAHVALNRIDIFLFLFGRVGVVETQVAAPSELFGDAEVQTDGLRMSEVQVAVWLRRKARHHSVVFSRGEVRRDNVADEIAARVRPRCVTH